MGSVELRATSTWLGAWEYGLGDVAKTMDCKSWLELQDRWPALTTRIHNMDKLHENTTGKTTNPGRGAQRVHQEMAKRQRALTVPMVEEAKKRSSRASTPSPTLVSREGPPRRLGCGYTVPKANTPWPNPITRSPLACATTSKTLARRGRARATA